jgi:hypothetical protein
LFFQSCFKKFSFSLSLTNGNNLFLIVTNKQTFIAIKAKEKKDLSLKIFRFLSLSTACDNSSLNRVNTNNNPSSLYSLFLLFSSSTSHMWCLSWFGRLSSVVFKQVFKQASLLNASFSIPHCF